MSTLRGLASFQPAREAGRRVESDSPSAARARSQDSPGRVLFLGGIGRKQ
jgi:hypothetical protein